MYSRVLALIDNSDLTFICDSPIYIFYSHFLNPLLIDFSFIFNKFVIFFIFISFCFNY